MDAVTYPDREVQSLIRDHFVPVQFNVIDDPGAMESFNSAWTPSILIRDTDGNEHRRSLGYLDAKRFLAEARLGLLQASINRQEWAEASRHAESAIDACRGDSLREPEAAYWQGVVAYKSTGDVQGLLDGWNRLIDRHPGSEWALKAGFIRN